MTVADTGQARDTPRRTSPAATVALRCIAIYQAFRGGRPSPCRYLPTCSAYAQQAVELHGAGRGLLLAVRRIIRCHPWGGHGLDPVPE